MHTVITVDVFFFFQIKSYIYLWEIILTMRLLKVSIDVHWRDFSKSYTVVFPWRDFSKSCNCEIKPEFGEAWGLYFLHVVIFQQGSYHAFPSNKQQ